MLCSQPESKLFSIAQLRGYHLTGNERKARNTRDGPRCNQRALEPPGARAARSRSTCTRWVKSTLVTSRNISSLRRGPSKRMFLALRSFPFIYIYIFLSDRGSARLGSDHYVTGGEFKVQGGEFKVQGGEFK
eukprot:537217-Prorocentrum_minimum.AAC.1